MSVVKSVRVYRGCGEEYKVVKRRREYRGCGEEYIVEKKGSNIIFPIILRLLNEYQVGKRKRGLKFWGRKSIFRNKMGLGKNIKFKGTLLTPAWYG